MQSDLVATGCSLGNPIARAAERQAAGVLPPGSGRR
jgi:hypothetical protein